MSSIGAGCSAPSATAPAANVEGHDVHPAVIGYKGSVSIEHEDGLMSVREGLEKAIAFLKIVMITEDPAAMWWA